MKFTSRIYQSGIHAINSLPIPLRNGLLRFLKFTRIPNGKFYKDTRYTGMVNVKMHKTSFKMHAHGGTIENEIFWKGLYNSLEPETIWIFENLLNNGIETVIDIGANTGLYSLLTAANSPYTKVIAFEPSKHIFGKLNDNVKLNEFEIKTEKLALSNTTGSITFYDSVDENQTSASLSTLMAESRQKNSTSLEYEVEVTTLDKYVRDNLLNGVEFLKIDVELHEREVFEGAIKTINDHEPYILFEVLIPKIATSLNEFFADKDYTLFEFVHANTSYKLKQVKELIGRPEGNWNYFACPNSRIMLLENLIAK